MTVLSEEMWARLAPWAARAADVARNTRQDTALHLDDTIGVPTRSFLVDSEKYAS